MKTLFKIISLALIFTVNCKAQAWQWAKSVDGAGNGMSRSIVTDAVGNVYITGGFIQPIIAGTYTLSTSSTSMSAYLIKYDSNGNVVWAKNSIGTYQDFGYCVTTDINGNVYMLGHFQSPNVVFGSFTLTNSGFAGNEDVFLVKYDSNGNVVWARSGSGNGNGADYGVGVTTDNTGNIIITGSFQTPVISFGSYSLTNTGTSASIFIVKYDANGNVLWAKSPTGPGYNFGISVSTDLNGNAFIVGQYSGATMQFGTQTISCVGSQNSFLAKYDAAGNVLWVKSIKSPGDTPKSISVDAGGNAYVTGDCLGSPTIIGSFTLANSQYNLFVAKFDPSGNALWAKSANSSWTKGYSISSFPGGAFVAGMMPPDGTPVTFGTYTLNSPSGYVDPMFVAQYDQNGNVTNALGLSSGVQNNLAGISVDRFCNAYVTSSFKVSSFVVGSNTLTQTGVSNIFTAKLTFTSALCWSNSIAENNYDNITTKIFPNPSCGNFTLKIDHEISYGLLIVSNSMGEQILRQKITSGINEIKATDISKGFYYFDVLENGRSISKGKIIIE